MTLIFPQEKTLEATPLVRHIRHAANVGPDYTVNRATLIGLHPRLWVKVGVFWVPGDDGRAPPSHNYGWLTYLQRCFSGDADKTAIRMWPVDPPLWGTERAPIELFDYLATARTDGKGEATVALTVGNPNEIPSTTRLGRIAIGHMHEVQTAASGIEIGVAAYSAQTIGAVEGRWVATASCYPSGQMCRDEWLALASRFQWGSAPPVQTSEATSD